MFPNLGELKAGLDFLKDTIANYPPDFFLKAGAATAKRYMLETIRANPDHELLAQRLDVPQETAARIWDAVFDVIRTRY